MAMPLMNEFNAGDQLVHINDSVCQSLTVWVALHFLKKIKTQCTMILIRQWFVVQPVEGWRNPSLKPWGKAKKKKKVSS